MYDFCLLIIVFKFFLGELTQMKEEKKEYLNEIWNLFDCAFIFIIFTNSLYNTIFLLCSFSMFLRFRLYL